MYRFPMPFSTLFTSQKKQRYFLFKLFLSSHRVHINRGIEERSLSSHVISINLHIKIHWLWALRETSINDCLSVLCFAAAHFATRRAFIFKAGRLHKCQSHASPQEARNLSTLRRKKIWTTFRREKPFVLFLLRQVLRCFDVCRPTAVFRNIIDAHAAPSPLLFYRANRVPLHHGSIYDNTVEFQHPQLWKLYRPMFRV